MSLREVPSALQIAGLVIALLVPAALVVEGVPRASPVTWGIVAVLAVVHTAGVYLLMNHALRSLATFQLAAIVNLTPISTALWAWLILGEQLAPIQAGGVLLAVLGVLAILRGTGRKAPSLR